MSAPAVSRTVTLPRATRQVPRSHRRATSDVADAKPRLHWAVVLLLVAWTMPFVFSIGPVRMTPYRLTLLMLFVPCLVWLAQGRAGRVRLPDILIVLFAIWCTISLLVVHGASGIQSAGIQVLETLTPYLLARCCIRTADDFYALAKFLTVMALLLLPFALYEAITGRNLYLEIAGRILPSIGVTEKEPRWGLRRVQLFFEHPILMGVCFGSILALTHLVVGRGRSLGHRWLGSAMAFVTAALSLSSGPLAGLVVQVALLGWNSVLRWFRARWTLLLSGLALAVLAVQLFAKRPLPNIILSLAFDPDSAFFRLLIWDYGTLSVANHPWFGVGLGSWDRPSWMGSSVDMFWLYNAIAFGLPGGLLMFGFFVAACVSVGRTRNLDARHADYRTAYLIAMTTFLLTGWMVHFWNGTYVFFIFMMGAGMWLRDAPRVRQVVGTGRRRIMRRAAATATRERPASPAA